MGQKDRRNEAKRKRRNQFWISGILIFLMVMSLAGILIGNDPSTQIFNDGQYYDAEYNGFKFSQDNSVFVTEVNGRDRKFYFHPLSVLGVDIPMEVSDELMGAPAIFVTFDPSSPDIQSQELSRFQLQSNMDVSIYPGITQNSSLYNNPLINCYMENSTIPVIVLRRSNTTQVFKDGQGCIHVTGDNIELLRATESLIYKSIGVT